MSRIHADPFVSFASDLDRTTMVANSTGVALRPSAETIMIEDEAVAAYLLDVIVNDDALFQGVGWVRSPTGRQGVADVVHELGSRLHAPRRRGTSRPRSRSSVTCVPAGAAALTFAVPSSTVSDQAIARMGNHDG